MPSDWSLHTHEGLLQKSHSDVEDFKSEKIKCETLHLNIPVEKTITSLVWSVLRPFIFSCDGETVSLYNSHKEHALNPLKLQFKASDESILNDVVTDMMIANGLTHEVMLTGSRNGVLKVWDLNFNEHGHEINGPTKLVTAAYLFDDQVTRIHHSKDKAALNQTFYKWDQPCGRVVCSGNLRVCKIWDAWAEKGMLDIKLSNKNTSVTSLSAELSNDLICLGKWRKAFNY
jgi:hypothetical protein